MKRVKAKVAAWIVEVSAKQKEAEQRAARPPRDHCQGSAHTNEIVPVAYI